METRHKETLPLTQTLSQADKVYFLKKSSGNIVFQLDMSSTMGVKNTV